MSVRNRHKARSTCGTQGSLVSTSYRVFMRWSIIEIVVTREPKFDEVILDWTSCVSAVLGAPPLNLRSSASGWYVFKNKGQGSV